MTSIPQLRRDINDLRAKLREAEAERDAALERVEVPGPERKVPTPCPKQADQIKTLSAKLREAEAEAKEQADQIKTLQSKLARFAKYDMNKFERWRKMCAIAEGK